MENKKRTISEIKSIFMTADVERLPEILEAFSDDGRAGVVKLREQYKHRYEAYQEELKRLDTMLAFERKYASFQAICGIDEAGRGPLAGPVVAAAVILPKEMKFLYLNDSKQLSAARREALYDEIMEKAISVGVGIVNADVIDKINILQADYEAMRIAVNKLDPTPDILLNDAVFIPGISIKQVSIVKGDARSLSIAAASVIAKVTRDRMMETYGELYAEYGFAAHKGYGSKAHIEALEKYGPCPIHRRSFIKNFIKEEGE